MYRDGKCWKCGKRKKRRPNALKKFNVYGHHRWRVFREAVLRRWPVCVHCQREGKAEPATTLDHIIRHTGPDDPRFLDLENVQPLCKRCHDRKTAAEEKGRYNNGPDLVARRLAIAADDERDQE